MLLSWILSAWHLTRNATLNQAPVTLKLTTPEELPSTVLVYGSAASVNEEYDMPLRKPLLFFATAWFTRRSGDTSTAWQDKRTGLPGPGCRDVGGFFGWDFRLLALRIQGVLLAYLLQGSGSVWCPSVYDK